MERLFRSHEIRSSRECDPLWLLTTPDSSALPCSEKVTVPGVWESHPALRNYRGRGVYEQSIYCGGNVRFSFAGVSIHASVFLDGQQIAEHYGAYTGFEAIVPHVSRGKHLLTVEADNRFDAGFALDFPNDYYAYGGINRPVTVEELADTYIASFRITPFMVDGIWTAKGDVHVRNLAGSSRSIKVCISVAGAKAEEQITVPAGEEPTVSFILTCNDVSPWSPEDPVLYTAEAVLYDGERPVDDQIERIGFREISISGKQILLNGSPLLLRGFNRHEEVADYGSAVPLSAMYRDIQLMRDMGANCVRTCHYPNDPRFLDLCDETGMLVWEESHARGLSEEQMRHPLFMEQILRSTEEMIDRDYNHPSVFIWGILNECSDDTEYGAACYREIFSLIRRKDPSRPVTSALLERAGGIVYDALDVVSFNLYPQWYSDKTVNDAIRVKQDECDDRGGANKPVIISEIGASAIYGYHDPLGESKWSEERQAAILREQLSAVLSDKDITGVFLWQFADVRVSEEWAMKRPRTFNNKGVVDEYRRPKLAYQVLKEIYHNDAEVHD